MDVSTVNSNDVREYLNFMRNNYNPRRITGGNERMLTSKSIRNIYITFMSFFHWASDEFDFPNPMKKVPPPKFTMPVVEPFTQEEVEALLKVCDYSEESRTMNRRKFRMRWQTAKRDRAIILTLLDTGLRASELCALRISSADLRTGKVAVKHGTQSGAKGGKGRTVYLGKTACEAVWRYLAERVDGEHQDAPLFVSRNSRPFNKDAMRLIIHSLWQRAGVKKCYTHHFRHSFAITYLRSDGDVFTLQILLGHSTLDMIKRYLYLTNRDISAVHNRVSPLKNWGLD